MDRLFIFFAATIISLIGCPYVVAEEIYVAQTSAGGNTGTNCANAHSVAWFNTAGNWGTGTDKISAGDTAHLCGNITTTLTVQASGSAGNVITILFESGAKMSKAAWSRIGAITISSKNYITIDGGATGIIGGPTGNVSFVNGIIENTDNGTGLGNQVDSVGINATNASYFTVKNLAIYNMYIRTAGTEQNSYGGGVLNIAEASNITNFTVTNCIIHDAGVGISSDYGNAGSNYTFSYNTIYNTNWGGRTGDRNSSSRMNGLYVHHNKLYNWTNWDAPTDIGFHHNGFYGWAESGGQLTNAYVYANEIGPNYSNSLNGYNSSTSGIFFSGNVSNIYIYNNLLLAHTGGPPANGMITAWNNNGYSGINIYNNTFIGNGSGNAIYGGMGNGTYFIKNNLAFGVATFIVFNSSASSTLVADYNFGYNLRPGQEYSKSATSSSSFKNFAQWKSLGYDVHGSNVNPLIDSNYRLTANSPGRDSGTPLDAYFTTDKDGTPRPQGPGWDIGAYEYATSQIGPPTNFRISTP
jgi:hypothetical protein